MPIFPPLNPPITAWTDQRIWIIGASRGIGAALAQEWSKQGARLCLSARQLTPLDPWLNLLPPLARQRILLSPLDIQHPEALHQTTQELLLAWGGIDLIVVAAGIYDALRASELDLSHLPLIQQTLNTNLLGPYHVSAAVLPLLRAQGHGHLAFISSVAGYNGLPRAMAYAPSKAALNNLCESLYMELRPLGIGVTRICPGFVATDMTHGVAFPMPALIQPSAAARAIVQGLERGQFEIHFPRHFTYLLKLIQWMPRRVYFKLLTWAMGRI